MKTKRKIYLGVGVVIITLLVFIGYSFAAPVLSWTPDSIKLVKAQGEKKSVIVFFSSNKKLEKVEVWLTPKLRPYLTVSPINFETIDKNIAYTLTLNFSIPFDAPVGVYKGTLHIRNTEKNSKTYSKPLPINLEIPAPEKVLLEVASDLRNGDIEAALTKFEPTKRHKKFFSLLGSEELSEIADLIENAELVEINSIHRYRKYKIEFIDNNEVKQNSEFMMLKNNEGEWIIVGF
jgi:hypothetical protein